MAGLSIDGPRLCRFGTHSLKRRHAVFDARFSHFAYKHGVLAISQKDVRRAGCHPRRVKTFLALMLLNAAFCESLKPVSLSSIWVNRAATGGAA